MSKDRKNRRFKVIACNVMWREISYYAALSPNAFTLQFMPWGLHEEPKDLRAELQKAVDATEDEYDAILLGYGLCSKGVEDIVARNTRLVITRGHDCITCFLGSKERYREYFDANPGTYWYTPGWIENHVSPGQERYETLYKEYLAKFGEDNAKYLMEMEQDWFQKYTTAAYIDLGVGNTEQHLEYTQQCADWLKWKFDMLEGDAGLIVRMLDGQWKEDEFLVVEPGCMIKATNEDDIMTSVPATPIDRDKQ
jgi:hypothetical protein